MNLKKLLIEILADGIRLIDKGAGVPDGTRLTIRYLVNSKWETKHVAFEREPRTLLHLFRRSMFIYTGARPERVLVELAEAPRIVRKRANNRSSFFEENNFSSYPRFDDTIWSDESSTPFFSSEERQEAEFVPGGGEFGGAGATGDWSDEPVAEKPAEPASASAVGEEGRSPAARTPTEIIAETSFIGAPPEEPKPAPGEPTNPEIPTITTAGEVRSADTGNDQSDADLTATEEETSEAVTENAADTETTEEPNAY